MKKSPYPFVYGALSAIILIAYFLILSVFNLHQNPVFGLLNLPIMAAGMWLLIKKYKTENLNHFNYKKGIWALFRCGVITTLIYTGFFALYITNLNPEFLKDLIPIWENDYHTNPGIAIFTVALMGFSFSAALSLTYMQLFKRSWNTKEGNDHTY
ncbi:DUF4199 domain-containing protein [Zunongwangia sp. SCSIO 43204]|uniref:DUF4199 domain-containing protein n=1 Tax=Zunongwangia sp. SCSIO 43204 TaxID=2779359 RepID=UPI001CA96B68|nr:DUF4199 domain-containing protein [Zunongwangia sp. SCSIO 43204]UAB84409.1 DUF4199 domain-containing protein [Zunongwangia sp. SCSIO 43204]